MISRGIDPGGKAHAFCDLDAQNGGCTTFLRKGMIKVDHQLDILDGLDPSSHVVAIERAYGLRIGAMAGIKQAKSVVADLLIVNWYACEIVIECRRRGIRVFEVDQALARHGIGVVSSKSGSKEGDMRAGKQIEECLKGLVAGWPTADRSSNPHERDAAVYALHGGHLLSVEAGQRYDAEDKARGMAFGVAPPGTFGPGDVGPDSFGGSDY